MPDMDDQMTFVARLRGEGTPEEEIAARVGVTVKTLWARVGAWNRDNPENPVPRPASRPEVPFYVQAAQMRKQGLQPAEIAQRMDRSISTVHRWLSHAREVGKMPPHRTLRDEGGTATWRHYAQKGAVPRMGCAGTLLSLLTTEQVEYLIGRIDSDDTTFAHTLARILKEHLDGKNQKG